jgi:hypothetical protein
VPGGNGDAAADGDELREDADGDLGWCDRTDLETDRRVHAIEAFRRHALGEQNRTDARDFRAASDEAQIAQIARGERPHGFEIVLVASRDDHDVRGAGDLGSVQPLGDRFDDDRVGIRESLAVGELLSIVDDVEAEARVDGDAAELPADVPGANHIEARRRRERVHVHVHLSPADEAILLREIVVQLVVEEGLASRRNGVARLETRIVLITSPADRSNRAAVGEDEHLCPGTLRCRSVGADDRHERHGLAARQRLRRRRQDLFVQIRTSREKSLAKTLDCTAEEGPVAGTGRLSCRGGGRAPSAPCLE